MDPEIEQKHILAGTIASQALYYGKSLLKPGVKVVDVLDKIELKITELGGKPAFPAQISLNEVAAHHCAELSYNVELQDQVIKLDVGVHIDGYIADNALSVDLSGKYPELIKASKEALDAAIKTVRPGVKLGDIGKTVHEVITSYGYAPVRNLSGHGLGHYKIHTAPSIPNFDNHNSTALKEGMAIAIEPFASMGSGMIQERPPASVFTFVKDAGVRDPITRNILKEIKTYNGLPFAKRWLERKFGSAKASFALRNLERLECLYAHPPLVDKGMVSQFEHSMIVKDKPLVFTRYEE